MANYSGREHWERFGNVRKNAFARVGDLDYITNDIEDGKDIVGNVSITGDLTLTGDTTQTGDLTITGNLVTASNVGTANTGVTAVEHGDSVNHTTVLTVSQAAALTLADNASLADGYLLYTLPTGSCVIDSAYMSILITNAEHDTEACDVGLGTVIGTGAVATLDGTSTFEDLMTGQTAAVGTAEEAAVQTTKLITTAGAHTIHFNAAAAWADTAGTALDADIAGTVVINWTYIG